MAKSASETKVEDVLSSVRRLVSEELPRNERASLPEGPGALVLTNAQRIESKAPVRVAGRTLEERIAELEAAVGETANDDEFEPDGSEDQSLHRPDRIVYTRPPLDEESDEMRRNTLRLSQIALLDTGPADDADEESDVELHFRREGATLSGRAPESVEPPEAPMAEDVKETLTAAEVHVFTSPDDEIARIEARLNGDPFTEPEPALDSKALDNSADVLDVDAADLPEIDLETLIQDAESGAAFDNDFEDEDDKAGEDAVIIAPVVASSAPKMDMLHKVVGAMKLEPSNEATDAYLNVEMSEVDFDAELDEAVANSIKVPEEPAPAPAKPQETLAEDASKEAETALAEEAIGAAVVDILDEDDLRPIVSQMIREELQGELGERITRNVRKLVRREILRALAARDTE